MSIRFLADEDIDDAIIHGLKRREPAIDILDVKKTGLRGTEDPRLLEIAVSEGRIMITHDRTTMTRFARELWAAGKSIPGVFVLIQNEAIGEVIEDLLLIWAGSEPEEWRDRIVYLPFQ